MHQHPPPCGLEGLLPLVRKILRRIARPFDDSLYANRAGRFRCPYSRIIALP